MSADKISVNKITIENDNGDKFFVVMGWDNSTEHFFMQIFNSNKSLIYSSSKDENTKGMDTFSTSDYFSKIILNSFGKFIPIEVSQALALDYTTRKKNIRELSMKTPVLNPEDYLLQALAISKKQI